MGCNCDIALRTPRSPTVSSYGDGLCLFQSLYNVYLALLVEGRDHRVSKMCAWRDGVLWFQCVDESPKSQIFCDRKWSHIGCNQNAMSLVIAVALALDVGSLAVKTFVMVLCPFMRTELLSVFFTGAAFSNELWLFSKCFCIVLVLAEVYGINFLQCFQIVFVLSVICHAVSYFHRESKMLPHQRFKCRGRIFSSYFSLTLPSCQ